MDKEKEPLVPDMKPSQEDIALRQKQLQARRIAAQRAAAAKAGPSAAATVAAPVQKQTLAVVALVVAVAMGGLAAFLFTQLQTLQGQFANAEALLKSQAANINVLNEKLSVTGENANLSLDALKVIIKEHDTEIRKLWDVANKRNKADIASNEKAITSLKGSLAGLDKELKASNDKQQKALAASDAALQKKLDAGIADLKKKIAKVEAQVLSMPAETELRVAQNTESIQSLEAAMTKMRQSGAGGNLADMKLEIEDIQIRLDRIQNALGGGAQ
ncbi:hypothetical protein [Thalassolituus hydrocarboniclasticus]|uniref:Uncharacterized protein n=1 Tax=Thalassolituus hydrocarboniclasticus TaxID=2742796 RepID=A0ABY6ACQ8_9GAMM|nr:hypothetical protein [Thalassolituus hydrocarboniclasticus]UXD88562.1 hypothetical protein HUF19_14480 [Thalassolituus hydrocarboniclasticus]